MKATPTRSGGWWDTKRSATRSLVVNRKKKKKAKVKRRKRARRKLKGK